MGYALMLPGVPQDRYQSLKDSLGVRVLEYTSDAQQMGDHARYNAAAARYADRYNRELLRRIDTACGAPGIDMSGWVERGGRAFTIQLPPAFAAEPAQGVDSEVGRWTDGTTRISYDYGAYSNDLSEPGTQRERRVCEVRIGGRPARVVIARGSNGEYIAAAHWPNLRTNAVGTISLTVSGTAADPQAQRTVLASLWSVRIRD